jgi:hypothetical protein
MDSEEILESVTYIQDIGLYSGVRSRSILQSVCMSFLHLDSTFLARPKTTYWTDLNIRVADSEDSILSIHPSFIHF